jgi:hypothetical protein
MKMNDKDALHLAHMTHMSSDAPAEAIRAINIIKEDTYQKISPWSEAK